MTIEELKIIIEAETKGLKTELKKVQSQLETVNKSATKTQGTFKKLFKGLRTGVAIAALTKFAKSALEAASNLEEVQNVVDIAFGESSEKVEQFSKVALKSFGMSEYAAKKAASTYMLMAENMGLSHDAAETMSLQLTALTGDMASLYNISHDVAQTALASVFTGETESLRKLGIVLTEANLQEYALSQNIKKSYSEMTQAEKAVLRYNFVLGKAAEAQGDFTRTSGSWANQMRILNGQWREFSTLIGQLLTNILQPFLKMLNNILSVIIAVGYAFKRVFGRSDSEMDLVSSADPGIGNDMKDAEKSAEGVAASFGEALGASNKIKKNLAGFDEINNLSNASSSGGAGVIDIPALNVGELYNMEEVIGGSVEQGMAIIDNFFKWIQDNWYKLLLGLLATIGAVGFGKVFGKIAKETFKNISDIIGGQLGKGLGSQLMLFITQIPKMFTQTFASIGTMVSGFVSGAATAFSKLWIVLTQNPIAWVIEAIILAGIAIYDLWNNCEWFRNTMVDLWNEYIKPIIDEWGKKWDELYSNHLEPMFNKLVGEGGLFSNAMEVINLFIGVVMWLWDVFKHLVGWVVAYYVPMFVGAFDGIVSAVMPIIGNIVDAIGGIIDILNGIITFILGVFTGDWERAWDGVVMVFKGIWDTLISIAKIPFNIIIGMVNTMLGAIEGAISGLFSAINNINIKVPDWVPLLGGKKFGGFNLKAPSIPKIPHLADGGLAYGQTLAMIGEYDGANNNPEVVAPLSKLESMMNVDLLAQKLDKLIAVVDSKEFNAYISQRDVGKAAINYINGQSRILGGSVI